MANNWKHQAREFAAHVFTPARALLWQMRTGKSKAVIDLAFSLYNACEIDGVIVIAPNGVHLNWILNQLPAHAWPNTPYVSHAWRFSQTDNFTNFQYFMTQSPFAWLSINMEALRFEVLDDVIKSFIRSRPNFLLVVDESHHMATPGSKRTMCARNLARHAKYRRILTGTPVEDSPLQAYAQFNILDAAALGHSNIDDFKTEFVVYETRKGRGRFFEQVKEYRNLETLRLRMARYTSVVLRSECEDLPAVQEDTRFVELSDATRRLYQAVKKQDARTLAGLGFQTAPDGAALLTKLQQIEGGFVKVFKDVKDLKDNAKIDVVLDEAFGYTSLVFAEYLHELESIAMHLRTHKFTFAVVHGSAPNRAQNVADFQAGKLDVLVMQTRCGAEGYDLSSADKIIVYSQTHTARIRAQGRERASAVGHCSKQVVNIVVPNGVDAYYMALTDKKTSLADDLARRGLKDVLEGLAI